MMHDASLSAKKFAIMVAHGFAEEGFIAVQRAMMQATAQLKVIAPHGGLANGRSESGTGMSYPVDAQLSETLAIDYDGLVIPAGQMHLDKLAEEPHAARLIRAFQREDMPVLVIEPPQACAKPSPQTASRSNSRRAVRCALASWLLRRMTKRFLRPCACWLKPQQGQMITALQPEREGCRHARPPMTDQLVSPCISICEINPRSGLCRGCWRKREEIARWPFMTAQEQHLLLDQLRTAGPPRPTQPVRAGSGPLRGQGQTANWLVGADMTQELIDRIFGPEGLYPDRWGNGHQYVQRRAGAGRGPELWNVEQPEKVGALHKSFIEAGSDLI